MTPSAHSSCKRRWWLPSIRLWIWLAFFLGLTLSNWRQVLISADGDPCLHWRIGKWMIEHHAVIRADQFSHTRPGAPVVSMEWLSELMIAMAGNLLGWNGIVLWTAALIATALWLLHRQLLSEGVELLLATGLVLLAAMACSVHWLARPHIVSLLLLVVWAFQLRQFHQDRLKTRALFLRLVPLAALWVNLHPGVFTGIMLIGLYFIGEGSGLLTKGDQRQRAARKMSVLAALGASCLAASLLNPNGWKLHVYIAGFLKHHGLVSLVNEFRSPNFHSGGSLGFLLLLLVLGAMLMIARPRLSFIDMLLISWAGYSALHWARNIPAFAVIVTPILAEHLNVFLKSSPEMAWVRLYRRVSRDIASMDHAADGRLIGVVAVAALFCAIVKPQVVGGKPFIETEISTNRFPVAAVQFVHGNPNLMSGEMFSSYGWGGYLILYLPERKVFIDGRNDFYGEELINEFNKPDEVKPGWEDVFAKYHVGWTILPRTHPLCALLALRADWKQVYHDDVAVIYTRQPAETQNASH